MLESNKHLDNFLSHYKSSVYFKFLTPWLYSLAPNNGNTILTTELYYQPTANAFINQSDDKEHACLLIFPLSFHILKVDIWNITKS